MHAHVDPAEAFEQRDPYADEPELPVRDEQPDAHRHGERRVVAHEGEVGLAADQDVEPLVVDEGAGPLHEAPYRHVHQHRDAGRERRPDERGHRRGGVLVAPPAYGPPAPQHQQDQGEQQPVLADELHAAVEPVRRVLGQAVDVVQQVDVGVRTGFGESSHGAAAPSSSFRGRSLSCAARSTPVVVDRLYVNRNAHSPSVRSTLHRMITQTLSKRDTSPQLRAGIKPSSATLSRHLRSPAWRRSSRGCRWGRSG